MRTDDFDYDLPPELIAQTPAEARDAARLLVLDRATGAMAHRRFSDLPDELRPGDLLVMNDSRVIPARLFGRRAQGGGRCEVLLLHERAPDEWTALVRPSRRLRLGARVHFAPGMEPPGSDDPAMEVDAVGGEPLPVTDPLLIGEIVDVGEEGLRTVRFQGSAPVSELLGRLGHVPLPPYIHAPLDDRERYQTVYARERGSAAAPTAGLHFTPALLERLQECGIRTAFVTLHIGLDTFRPVAEDDPTRHQIHSEFCRVPAETADLVNATHAAGGRIVAVGTTSVRTLETAADDSGRLRPYEGWSRLYILPGRRFRVVDALVTNFHLPRSTLLMLVSAFAGREHILAAYHEATRLRYRFYSFGDAMLIMGVSESVSQYPANCSTGY